MPPHISRIQPTDDTVEKEGEGVWWRLGWHVVAHGCYIGTPSGTPTARPAHIRPCLALSPLGFSCVCMCDPSVRCILAHSDAFLRINLHNNASIHVSLALSPLSFSCISLCDPTVRCILAHFDAFMCIPVHTNASSLVHWNTKVCTWMLHECIKARMQHIRKCIKLRMH